MKSLYVVIACVAASLAATGPAVAACPSNATLASLDIWPQNSLVAGETVTGTHSCGRRIRCTSGNTRQGLQRTCRWL